VARIVLVDDTDIFREALEVALQRAGHDIIGGASGLGIERLVAQHKADLVITDMLMPDRDGVETVMALRRRYPELRLIAMSGGGSRGNLDLGVARQLGVSATIAKPFEPAELVELVSGILAGPAPGRSP
jgi:DNA-binding NarL/FixJ family response regulator